LTAITKQEVDALAKKHLPYDKMLIVVVGDRTKVYDGLTKLGYEVIELDMEGNIVKTDTDLKQGDSGRNDDVKPVPPNKRPPSNGKRKATPVKVTGTR
jgi:zinc protease